MFVFIDTETGGLDPAEVSLLTVAAAIVDDQFNVLDKISFGVKPEVYVISPGAIMVNKIDLAEHAKFSMTPQKAGEALAEFLHTGMILANNDRLIPAGHNVAFDLNFIWRQLMPEEEWKKYCAYPALDTAALARFFYTTKLIPAAFNLVALRQLFNIDTGEAHDAMNDVLASVEVAKKFSELVVPQLSSIS
jgi:DNA polymerase III epsilon subunit-like protein